MNFNNTDHALLSLLRHSLFASESTLCISLSEEEWKNLITHADALGVSVAVFQGALALSPTLLPKHFPEAWSELVHLKNERSESILAEEATVSARLFEARIPHLFLSDTAAASYYPDPSLRTVWHTECLCDRPIAETVAPLSLSFPFTVKQNLNVPKEGMEAIRLRSLLARALDSFSNGEIGEYVLPVPSATVQALILLLEAEQKPSLLLLLDFALLFRHAFAKQEINLAMQVRSWEQCSLLDTAKTLALAASIAFDFEADEWFSDANKETAEQLLSSLLIPEETKLARAEKNLSIALSHATKPPKAPKKKTEKEKNAISRFFGSVFGKK